MKSVVWAARVAAVVAVVLVGLGDGLAAQAPSVSGLSLNSPTPPGQKSGQTAWWNNEVIRVTVTFSASVDVTGTPQVTLGIGSCTDCLANYESGTGTTALVFAYRLQHGDTDSDGLSIAANALQLNGGTINASSDAAAASLDLTGHTITDQGTPIRRGAWGRGISRIDTQNDRGATYQFADTYVQGDTILVDVVFDGVVRADRGVPINQLRLTIGDQVRLMSYVSGHSNSTWRFRYVVQPNDLDTDGFSLVGDAFVGNFESGLRRQYISTNLGRAAVVNSSMHKVNGAIGPPGVSDLSFNTPIAADTYERDDTIVATVTFTKAVDVDVTGGTPQLGLGIGSNTRQAQYVSGTGTTALEFRYVATSSDGDGNGLSIAASALGLNGGTIMTSGSTTENALLSLTGHAFTDNASYKVSGSRTAAAVSGVSIASVPPADETYGATERIEVEVTFNRPVDVVTTGGTPQLALDIGGTTRQAAYASGTGTRALRFSYTVVGADADTDGIEVAAGALTLNSGAINDGRSSSLAAALGLGTHVLTAQAGHKVDGTIAPAAVSGLSITSSPASGDTYGLGERIALDVTFDQAVTVTGVPQLEVEITGTLRQARYVSGSGTDLLTFEYWVQGAGSGGSGPGGVDRTSAGIMVSATALTLNGGTIENVLYPERGFSASLSLAGSALGSPQPNHKVDGRIEAVPVVTGARVTSAPSNAAGYVGGREIVLRVTFSRAVGVTGTPRLALVIGGARRQARYVSGSGTSALEFRYRVGPADIDPDGFSVPADALDLAGGALVIAGGSAVAELDLGVHALENVEGHAVAGGGATDPYFDLLEYEFELTENVAGPVEVGAVSATDPYEEEMKYGLGEGGEGLFEVDEWEGGVTYVGEGADAEDRSEYVLEVVATAADGRSGKGLVRVRVMNVNEAPSYGNERIVFGLAENVAGPVVLGTAAAVDLDEGEVLTYRLESGDAALFEVDAASAEVRYVGSGEDFDAGGARSWELGLVATDKAGLSAGTTVVVVLEDENEGPAFADSAYAFEFAENVPGPLVLGTVRATDPDPSDRLTYGLATGDAALFEVDAASGQVRYVGPGEDAETSAGSWQLTVRATDAGGLTAHASVAVALLDRNEAPSFADASYEWEFEENVPGPLVLGTVRASDPDGADTLTYSLSGAGAELFEVDAASGEVRYAGSGEDAETGPESWAFEVVAADADGLEDRVPATVMLLDVNEAPVFADSAYAFEFPENAAGPRELGRVEASDVDEGDVLTYGLAAGDADRFEVDASSGVVRYVGGGEDYEAGPREYALTLRVTDAGGLTDEAGAVVALLDVNEGPEAVGTMAPKVLEAYGAGVEEDLGPYFRDPDGDALSYAAESSSEAVAVVGVSSGRLSISPRAIGVATVTVRATDPGGMEAMQRVDVTVEASRSERARAMKLALAAFGRSIGTETVEAIGGRLGLESSSVLGRSHVQVGSRSIGCGAFGGGSGGTGESSCGWEQLARGASGLLGLQLTGPAALGRSGAGGASVGWEQLARGATGLLGLQLTGPAAVGQGGASVSLDAVSLFNDDRGGLGAQDMASGFGAAGSYMGQQEPAEGSAGLEQRGGLTFNPVSAHEMRSQSSFQLSFGGDGDDATGSPMPSQQASRTGWTLWGQANAGEFESSPDDGLSLEGRTRSAYVGLDYRFGSGLLLGLAGSRSTLASDFESGINGAGTVDATLTSLYPYLHWSPREGLGLWGLVGAGMGDADLAEVAGGGQFSTDLDMRMAAMGARQELVGALALRADAFSVSIESADGGQLAGVTAVAQRVRLAPELTGQWTVADGGVALRTRLEVGGRYDGGDAETGLGAEAGAEFGFAHLSTGFSVSARGRTLLAHQAEQFREWGASFSVRLQPGGEQGGLSFSLEPSWGDAASGAQALWQAEGGGGLGGQAGLGRHAGMIADAPGWTPDRLAMEVGWGVVLPGGGQVVPFGRWSREGADGYRVNAGTRWTSLGLGGEPGEGEAEGRSRRGLRLMIDLFGEQVANGVQPAERRIGLLGKIGFQ